MTADCFQAAETRWDGWLPEASMSTSLSDINMPGMNGLDLLRTVKTLAPDLPFILISGLCDLHTAHGAMRAVRSADLLGRPCSIRGAFPLTAR
jgi:DNA-binding NtrC family response regulator